MIYRDAKTGRFTTKDLVKRRPATTVTESTRPRRKKRKRAR
jgi:hypothetical protein